MKTTAGRIFLTALCYFIAGRLADYLSIPPGFASPVWPAAGIALVAVMLGGHRMAAGVWLGSLMVNTWNVWETFGFLSWNTPIIGGFIGIGAACQALVGARLVRNHAGLTNIPSVFHFLALVGPASCLIGACIGVTTLTLAGTMPTDQILNNIFTWWIGDSLGVLVMAPIIPVWRHGSHTTRTMDLITFFSPMVLIMAVTISFFVWVRNLEAQRAKLSMESSAQGLIQSIQGSMEHALDTLHMLKTSYYLDPNLSREHFKTLTEPMRKKSTIQALEWVPKVPQQQREAFEAKVRSEGFPDFTITQIGSDGLTTAAEQPEYFPIYCIEPLAGNESALGLDLSSNALRAAALKKAYTTKEAAATKGLQLVQDPSKGYSILVFLPVFSPQAPQTGTRWNQLLGFVGGAFHLDNLVNRTGLIQSHPDAAFAVFEKGGENQYKLLFFSDHNGSRGLNQTRGMALLHHPNGYTRSFQFAGRTLYFSFLPKPNLISAWTLWGVLITGFLFTSMMGAFLLLGLGRTTEIEITVEERTRALAEANTALEAEVRERALTQTALLEAKENAERATRIKSDFLATMSHEIRTPMNGIIGMNRLLLDLDLNDEQREHAETVQNSAESLLAIINDILDFSKIEAGKLELEHIVFSLRHSLEEAVELIKPRIRQKGLDCHLHVDSRAPDLLKGDPGRLRQVLLNLVTNALKFTEKGSITIRTSLVSGDKHRAMLLFEVTDTGIGIPETRRHRLFQSFSQVDASTTRKYGGTGLGLAISANLAKMMGGEIGVDSVEGKGSRFWFTSLFECALEKRSKPRVLDILPQYQEDGFRLLVVEDNMVNQKVAVRLLKKMNINANVVGNGLEAVEAFQQIPYDLILMDCQMPEMDGYQATSRIRELEREKGGRIPIIAMTANAMKGDREKCLDAGMDDYIAKPVKIEALARVVQNWLKADDPAPPNMDSTLY